MWSFFGIFNNGVCVGCLYTSSSIIVLVFMYYVCEGSSSVVRVAQQRHDVGAGDCRVTSGGLLW